MDVSCILVCAVYVFHAAGRSSCHMTAAVMESERDTAWGAEGNDSVHGMQPCTSIMKIFI